MQLQRRDKKNGRVSKDRGAETEREEGERKTEREGDGKRETERE